MDKTVGEIVRRRKLPRTTLPSNILNNPCCTPSPDTSRDASPPEDERRASLSASSRTMIPVLSDHHQYIRRETCKSSNEERRGKRPYLARATSQFAACSSRCTHISTSSPTSTSASGVESHAACRVEVLIHVQFSHSEFKPSMTS